MTYTDRMPSDAIGFQKLAFSPRLTGAALGGTLGFAASPEDEGQAAGLTGAAMGYGVGSLADHLMKRRQGAATPAAPGAPATPGPAGPPAAGPGYGPEHMAEVERHLSGQALTDQITKQVEQTAAWQREQQRSKNPLAGPPTRLQEAQARLQALQGARGPKRMQAQQAALAILPPEAQHRVTAARSAKRMPRLQKVGFAKLADISMGTGVGPFSVGMSEKDVRLPGMNRWVPRGTVEQAYQGLQQGLDQQALLEEAAEAGNLKHPAIGAGLAAALAHYGLPGVGAPGLGAGAKVLAAGVGGGVGAIYNQLSRGRRVSEMREAIKGVHGEQEGMGHHSAREDMPLVVSGAGGNQ